MTAGPDGRDGAFLLGGGTGRRLDPAGRTDLVRLADGRIGYATPTLFQPLGDDDDLEEITVNTGGARGSSVVSLVFADGEVRETVEESAAVVSRRLRADGYVVSSRPLARAAPPPPEQDVENSELPHDGVVPTATAPVTVPNRTVPPTTDVEEARPRPRLARDRAATYARRSFAFLRLVVLLVGGVVVGILVIHVLLVLAKANQKNDLVTFFRHASKPLAWKFKNLFEPRTQKANITENYLLAAAVYLVVTVAVARVLARLRGANPPRRP